MTDHVICYDIAHPRRLGRVFRLLRTCAMPLQYSVFLFAGDDRQLARVMAKLLALTDPEEDDLRAHPLPKRGLSARLGKAGPARGHPVKQAACGVVS